MELYEVLGWLNVWVYVFLTIKAPLKILNKRLKNKKFDEDKFISYKIS